VADKKGKNVNVIKLPEKKPSPRSGDPWGEGSIYRRYKWVKSPRTGEKVAVVYFQAVKDVAVLDPATKVKRKRITGNGASRAEAIRRRDENIKTYLENPTTYGGKGSVRTRNNPGRLTVGEFFEQWIAQRKYDRKLSEVMWHKNKRMFEIHILPDFGKRYLDSLTTFELNLYFYDTLPSKPVVRNYAKKRDNRLGAAARLNVYKLFSKFLNDAVEKKLLSSSPLKGVDRPEYRKNKENVEKAYEDLTSLLTQMKDKNNPDYCRMLFQLLGLRRGERLGLEWSSISGLEGEDPVMNVSQQLFRSPIKGVGWYLNTDTKNREDREIVLTEPWISALRKHKRDQDILRLKPEWKPDSKFADLIFLQPNGALYTHNKDNKDWHHLLTAHKIDPFRAHLVRHACATLLAAQTPAPPIGTVMKILGHHSESLSLYYSRTGRMEQRGPITRFGEDLIKKMEEKKIG